MEALKRVFVEASIEELKRRNETLSVARVSVMTGVHRKDVLRLINQAEAQAPSTGSLASRVLGQWQGDAKFLNQFGKPRILSFTGPDNEFSNLVHTVSRELNPSLVLFELERVGAVKRQAAGLKIAAPIFVSKGDLSDGLSMLAEDTADLIASVEMNLLHNGPVKNLHIKTEFDAIPDALLPEVSKKVLDEGTKFHTAIAKYLSGKDKDLNESLRGMPGRNRVAIGSFSITSTTTHKEE